MIKAMKKTYPILLILFFLQSSSVLASQKKILIFDEKSSSKFKNCMEINNANYSSLKKNFFSPNPTTKICIQNEAALRFAYDIVRVAELFPNKKYCSHSWTQEDLSSINFMAFPKAKVTRKNPSHEDLKKELLYKLYYLKNFPESPEEVKTSAGMFVKTISGHLSNEKSSDPAGSAHYLLKTIKDDSNSMPWQLRWEKIGFLDYKLRIFFEKIQSYWDNASFDDPLETNDSKQNYQESGEETSSLSLKSKFFKLVFKAKKFLLILASYYFNSNSEYQSDNDNNADREYHSGDENNRNSDYQAGSGNEKNPDSKLIDLNSYSSGEEESVDDY
jgi:hypothetical protein